MNQKKRKTSAGLDIGQTSAKAVCLAWRGRKIAVTRAEQYRFRDEGILGEDEQETFQAIGGWLKERKITERVVLGLPQYMATTQVNDFVKGIKGRELDGMVRYETTQLAGISDDSFLHDYAILPPGNGRENPVLIGICREANVNDFTGKASDVSIGLSDVAMNGLAMANAFFRLHPAESSGDGVQVLMDIGTETTTVAIVCSRQVLYIGSMMFGGANMTQEISQQLLISSDEAERRKIAGEVDWAELNLSAMNLDVFPEREPLLGEPPDASAMPSLGLKLPGIPDADAEETASDADTVQGASPDELGGLGCFRTLQREFSGTLEHWRASENEWLSQKPLSHIWLCGGGASVELTQTYLGMQQQCEVSVFGPEVEAGAGASPDYTIAYGLALQGLGAADVPISLAPRVLSWMLSKEARGKYLIWAFLLFFACLCGWMAYEYRTVTQSTESLSAQTEELRANVRKLTKLDGMKREYQASLMQVLPMVAGYSRSEAFLSSLVEFQKALQVPEIKECAGWCVYLADSDSFTEYNESKEAKAVPPVAPRLFPGGGRRRNQQPRILETTETENDGQEQWQETLTAEATVRDVTSVTPLTRVYAVGMIVSNHDNHNVIEREIMLNLRPSSDERSSKSFFGEVQVMNEEERKKCMERAVFDWQRVFNHIATNDVFKNYRGGYKPFFLRLGIGQSAVTPPAENPLSPPKKKKKSKK